MSWFEADEHCKSRGAHLVEINSEEENAAIVEEIMNGRQEEKSSFFWIGLTDENKEGTWNLASGAETTYMNWDKSYVSNPEPNNYDGNEHCAHIRSGGCPEWDQSAWADIDCSITMVPVQCDLRSEVPEFSMKALCEFETETGEYIDKDNFLRIFFNRWQQSTTENRSGHIRKHCTRALPSRIYRNHNLHLQPAKSKKAC